MTSTTTRCWICRKKTGIDFYTCKCNKDAVYCAQHRYPFEHLCTLDLLTEHQSRLKSVMGSKHLDSHNGPQKDS